MTAVAPAGTTDPHRPPTTMEIHQVPGGGGVRLHVREWGRRDGPPILFIHGWSQSHLCWAGQYASSLAEEFRLVAFDLRGHGMSEAPPGPEHYTDGRLWADDVAAVIAWLRLDRPVMVGWSYGPFVILDYIRAHGQEHVAAINLVAGAVKLGEAYFGTLIGPGFLDHIAGALSDDLPTSIAATRDFLHGCAATPLNAADFETALCASMVVPSGIRAGLLARQIDGDDVLADLRVPVLISHGRLDKVVLPAMADHVLATCPTAAAAWYDGVGHLPFLEAPERFNRDLAALTRRTRG